MRSCQGHHRSFDFLMVARRRLCRGRVTLPTELAADGAPYRIVLPEDRADIARVDISARHGNDRGSGAALFSTKLRSSAFRLPSNSSELRGTPVGAFAKPAATPVRRRRNSA